MAQLGQDLSRLAASIVSDPDSSDEHATEASPSLPQPSAAPPRSISSALQWIPSDESTTSEEGDTQEMKLGRLVLPGTGCTLRPAHHARLSASACLKPHMPRAGGQALDLIKKELCCTPAAYPDAACCAACTVSPPGRRHAFAAAASFQRWVPLPHSQL